MIHYQGKELTGIFHKTKAVSMIYHYAKVVYQAIRSCFGSGTWRSDRPWLGKDLWKNK